MVTRPCVSIQVLFSNSYYSAFMVAKRLGMAFECKEVGTFLAQILQDLSSYLVRQVLLDSSANLMWTL